MTATDTASAPGSNVVVQKLEEFFSRPDFTSAISDFGNTYAYEFRQLVDAEDVGQIEHPLRWTTLYNEYTSMIEAKLEAFLDSEDVPIDDLIDLVSCNEGREHACIDYLLASTEYMSFLQLMQDFVSMKDWSCEEVDVALEDGAPAATLAPFGDSGTGMEVASHIVAN